MEKEDSFNGSEKLRFASSGTKIVNQFLMFVVIGLLPVLFPSAIKLENRNIIFINVSLALTTSYIYEIWRTRLQKNNKDTTFVINLQLITNVVLLTIFLHFFGRINGPFFILYLLAIMESFLNRNLTISNIIVVIMVYATSLELVLLSLVGEIALDYLNILEFLVRIMSILFIRSYGFVLSRMILSEETMRQQAQKTTAQLQDTTLELSHANLRLKELSLLKDEFVSIASHELRTPMTAIKSYLWLVLNKKKNLDEQAKRYLQIAYESTERTIVLVKDMLTVSRIEGNRLDVNFSTFDLKELASQVVSELKIKANEKEIDLKIRPFLEDLAIDGDKDKIGEVFLNIIGNALKFTPNKGNVEIYFQKKNNTIQISVSDNGPGIAKKDMSKLFQKFSRLGNSLSEMAETPGTGLGLYIAKQIVDLHKGKIWVESTVGKGSTFIFSLPLGERTYDKKK